MTVVQTWRAALDRLGLRTALRRDAALALAVAVLTAAVLIPLTGPFADPLELTLTGRQRVVVIVLTVAQAVAVAVRRVRPGLCLLFVTALQVGLIVTVAAEATVRGAAPLIAFYTAGTCLPLGRLLRWGGAALVIELLGAPVVATLVGSPLSVGTWLAGSGSAVITYGIAAAIGVAVAARRENVALLRARAEAAERARVDDARRAVEAERLRMARELHDIAAHHLTGLLVQASAAERLVGPADAAARDALHEVRHQGKQALDNLRAVVGVLRQDGSTRELDPVPGLTVLPDLIDAARALGDQVGLQTRGAPYPLAAVADVTAYRVTQEALSNARQHAPGAPVTVVLAYDAASVELTVRNAAPPVPGTAPRTGYGLAGMAERAALVGGSLRAGLVAGSTWEVALTLPGGAP